MRFSFCLTALLFTAASAAASLQVSVKDARGQAIPDVVVVATAALQTPVRGDVATATVTAIMDQIDKRFVPEVLIVRAGTSVSFPNSDAVAHQVYSFSPAKQFALPLYRGRAHPPLIFDQPGIVVLGCNIHDQMVGYIYVTSSPHFGKTDDLGKLTMSSLSAGNYRVTIWHPRLDESAAERDVEVADMKTNALEFQVRRAPRVTPRTDNRIRDY